MRARRPRSIRRLVLTLFAASVLVAVILLAGYEAIVTSYYRGESSFVTRFFQPPPPVSRTARTSSMLIRKINAAILQGPDKLADQAFLRSIADDASPLCVVLRVGRAIAFSSVPLDEESVSRLPAFGALMTRQDEAFHDEPSRTDVLFQIDFRSSAGLPASFFIIHKAGPQPRRPPFTRQIALVAALILLAADGAAGVYFILRLTSPLRKVEAAALAMSRGDLRTPVEGAYQIIELQRVFGALETMRTKVGGLLDRERESEAERRELIANLSHDLRTPLASIRGYVDGLREGIADTPEKQGRYLAVLGQKIQDLDRMIGQIFLLSTLEAHEAPPELRDVDLRAFLRDSVEELRLSRPPDVLRISDEGLEGLPLMIRADPLQLRRVVENIVDNSLRHGGKKPIAVAISLTAGGGSAELLIVDDGKGIDPEEAPFVFDRFYRGDPSRQGGGVGLGLAIAKRIVEAQGGSIRLAAEPRDAAGGDGARFSISLPLMEAAS